MAAVTWAQKLSDQVVLIGGERDQLQVRVHASTTAIAARDFKALNKIDQEMYGDAAKYDPRYSALLDLATRFKEAAALCSKSS